MNAPDTAGDGAMGVLDAMADMGPFLLERVTEGGAGPVAAVDMVGCAAGGAALGGAVWAVMVLRGATDAGESPAVRTAPLRMMAIRDTCDVHIGSVVCGCVLCLQYCGIPIQV